MGTVYVNVEIRSPDPGARDRPQPRCHASPHGEERGSLWFHQEEIGLDELHPLSFEQMRWLSMLVRGGEFTFFEARLKSMVTPTGGWSEARVFAVWRAASALWGQKLNPGKQAEWKLVGTLARLFGPPRRWPPTAECGCASGRSRPRSASSPRTP